MLKTTDLDLPQERWTKNIVSEDDFCRILSGSKIEKIIIPMDGKLRSRTVVKRSNYLKTIKFPSRTMGRMLQCESRNELNFYRVADVTPEITSIYDQPLEIVFTLNGKRQKHFPDSLLTRGDYDYLLEVKPHTQSLGQDLFLRTDVLTQLLKDKGYEYRLIDGSLISNSSALPNALLLSRYAQLGVNKSNFSLIERYFYENSGVHWNNIFALKSESENKRTVAFLIIAGQIKFDRGCLIEDGVELYWDQTSKSKISEAI